MGKPQKRCRCRTAAQRADCQCRRSDIRWVGRPRVGGHWGRAQTFDTKGEAQQYIDKAQADAGSRESVHPYPDEAWLFCDWVEQWRRTRAVRKPSTQAADRARLPHLVKAFGKVPLASITSMDVGQWVADLVDDGYAAETVRRLHAMLSGILQKAVRDRLIRENPCEYTDLPELISREAVFLDEVEMRALLAAHDDYWRPFPLTLAGTGLRFGEAVGLRVRYVNLSRAELRVAWTWNSTFGWRAPKAHSQRTIGLSPTVVAALEPLVAGRGPDEHVFTMPSGVPVHHGYRVRVWRPALVDAGLAGRGLRPHDLRHTHASHLIADGVPLTAIQRRLGHKSIAITSDRYGHLLPRVEESLLASVERSLVGVPDYVPEGLLTDG